MDFHHNYKNDIHNLYKDTAKYALSDWKILIKLGLLMALVSVVNKMNIEYSILNLSDIFTIFIMGYGIYISYYTLEGSQELPKIKNPKKMFWEGFKKFLIITFYTIFLTYLSFYTKYYFNNKQYLLCIICVIIFNLIWFLLTGALLNKFINKNNFFKAFDIIEIIRLLRSFDMKNFIILMVVVLVTQFTIINVFIDYHPDFTLLEFGYVIVTFILSPFVYILNKRLVGIQLRRLLRMNK